MMDEILTNVENIIGNELSYDDKITAEEMIRKGYDSLSIAHRLSTYKSF